jgi:hypothetical protein
MQIKQARRGSGSGVAASVKATDSCHATLMARAVGRLDAPAAVAPVAACPALRPLV